QPGVVVQGQGGGQKGLEARGPRGRLAERQPLVLGGGGRVGRGDHVDDAVAHRLDQRKPVALGPQRRIEPVEGAVVADVDLVEAQVVDRDAGGDLEPPGAAAHEAVQRVGGGDLVDQEDRKSTRLNSSHVKISYAVFC